MKRIKSFLLALLPVVSASPAFAQGDEPKRIGEIGTILDKVMDIVFPAAGLICVVFIIIGGYMWIASAGDPAKVKQAQGTLTWAIIGLVFVLISTLVVKTIVSAL